MKLQKVEYSSESESSESDNENGYLARRSQRFFLMEIYSYHFFQNTPLINLKVFSAFFPFIITY